MAEFIPKMYRSEQVTMRIDTDKLERIDQLAGQYGISRSALINQCIDFALQHMTSRETSPGTSPKERENH